MWKNGECVHQWEIVEVAHGFGIDKHERTMNNANNKIIRLDDVTSLKQRDRWIDLHCGEETKMIVCPHGSKVFHQIHGHKNFRINEMKDKNGHTPPQTKIKGVKIWFRDG